MSLHLCLQGIVHALSMSMAHLTVFVRVIGVRRWRDSGQQGFQRLMCIIVDEGWDLLHGEKLRGYFSNLFR
jgi:uncharacterized membrane protein YhaH (DUF805 family)